MCIYLSRGQGVYIFIPRTRCVYIYPEDKVCIYLLFTADLSLVLLGQCIPFRPCIARPLYLPFWQVLYCVVIEIIGKI